MLFRLPLAVSLLLVPLVAAGASPALAEPGDPELRGALADARALERQLVGAVDAATAVAVTVVGRKAPRARLSSGLVPTSRMSAVGSGVIIRYRGTWVLSNEHVVSGEPRLEAITADGARHRLRIQATSRRLDLALLAFERVPSTIRPVDLERAPPADLREGTWVLAVGNPFYLALDGQGVATLGVVSGMRPPDPDAYLDAPTLQHDAEINPGSSGGALWDLRGQLMGINGTIATRPRRRGQGGGPSHTGASFSVPVDAVLRFLAISLPLRPPVVAAAPVPAPAAAPVPATVPAPEVTRRPPVVVRPRTTGVGPGVRFRTRVDEAGRASGAEVAGAAQQGSARADRDPRDLRDGDLVTRLTVGGRTYVISAADDVGRILGRHPADAPYTLRFLRAGRQHSWSGRIGGG